MAQVTKRKKIGKDKEPSQAKETLKRIRMLRSKLKGINLTDEFLQEAKNEGRITSLDIED